MIVVNYHDDLNEVQGDAATAALLTAPYATAPFDRIEWWRNLAETCAMTPMIVISSDGLDRAILPLMRQRRALVGFQNWYSFRLTPLISKASRRAELLEEMASALACEAPRITLDRLSGEDAQDLASAFRVAGWSVWQAPSDTNHILNVGGSDYASFLAARPGQLRSTLKRKSGKLDVELFRTYDAHAYASYEQIYADSWKPEEGSAAFLQRFAQEEGAAGRLRMAIGSVDGSPVAAQFWTVENGTAFIHKLAHRNDAKALSPGTTLSAALFEEVIDRDRVSMVDFGTGDDAYKRDWMDDVRIRYRLDMLRPQWPGNWPIIALYALRRATQRG
ncbi:GNAT family N-acetyltransferase [Novosphingobium sp.]|uniref:GNAT family N-acetyltransferase n=1 Tax=Novosphingobium sp. TaxID=1874826 RepID=UPI0025E074FA|nr:GNAT family N-acetyltransferase [Novosphingobium sp.]